jgi:hypothetical protein
VNNTIWIKHPETGAVVEVPGAALPMYRQSGWDLLPDDDLDALERERVEELAAAERDMQEKADAALSAETGPGEDERTPEELAEIGDAALGAPEEPEPQETRTPEELAEIGDAALGRAEVPTAEDEGAVPGPYTDDQLAVAEELPAPAKDAGGRRTKKGNA